VPIRIYALAKELQIDSKELVEYCTKAGITGKGSALASLDDDEVVKVKAFMGGAKSSPSSRGVSVAPPTPSPKAPPSRPLVQPPKVQRVSPPPPAPTPPAPTPPAPPPSQVVEPPAEPPAEKPKPMEPVVERPAEPTAEVPPEKAAAKSATAKPTTKKPLTEQGEAEMPAVAKPVEETPPDVAATKKSAEPTAEKPATPSAAEPPKEPVTETPAARKEPPAPLAPPTTPAPTVPTTMQAPDRVSEPEPPGFTRGDYISAGGGSGKMRVLGGRPKATKPKAGDSPERPSTPKPRAPVIHVAQMPNVKQPPPTPSLNEPAPQKPDIRLPQDAIASAKAGTRPTSGTSNGEGG
jgi:translation initiation factor IF-2